jgi:hypothetical protein
MHQKILPRLLVTRVIAGLGTLRKSQNSLLRCDRGIQVSALLAILGIVILFVGCSVERDREEARAVAARVHAEMQSRDFAAIYNESAPRFKSVGNESEFVARMNGFQEGLGLLKSVNEIAYTTGLDSRVGRTHVLVFDLQYEHGRAREHLMLVRSASDKMVLWKLDIQPLE